MTKYNARMSKFVDRVVTKICLDMGVEVPTLKVNNRLRKYDGFFQRPSIIEHKVKGYTPIFILYTVLHELGHYITGIEGSTEDIEYTAEKFHYEAIKKYFPKRLPSYKNMLASFTQKIKEEKWAIHHYNAFIRVIKHILEMEDGKV